MSQAVAGKRKSATVFPVLCAISFCHMLNDMMQSLLPAIYPILKGGFDLNFGQIGLLTLIFQAKQRVWIATPYFIPDESLTRALELAGRRGIDVRLLVPRKSNHFLADLARGTYLRQLIGSGCRAALAEKMLHAKAFLVDGDYAILGSANFDMRSLLLNYEIGVLIRAGKPLADLEAWFQAQFLAAGTSDFKVNYWRDLLESLGRVLGPLI